MFIETDTQPPSKLRQERHVHSARPGGRDLLGTPFHAAPAGAWFASHRLGYNHVAPAGACRCAGDNQTAQYRVRYSPAFCPVFRMRPGEINSVGVACL